MTLYGWVLETSRLSTEKPTQGQIGAEKLTQGQIGAERPTHGQVGAEILTQGQIGAQRPTQGQIGVVSTYVWISSVCMFVCLCVSMFVCLYVCVFVCFCVSVFVCLYVCIFVYVHFGMFVCLRVLACRSHSLPKPRTDERSFAFWAPARVAHSPLGSGIGTRFSTNWTRNPG